MQTSRRALLALLGTAALAQAGHAAAAGTRTVAVTAIVEHPALDAVRDGIKEALAEAGFKDGDSFRFTYESAQGNPATAAQIARKLAGDRPDVIVPISTPSAQTVVSATKDIPSSSPPSPTRSAPSWSPTRTTPAATSPACPTCRRSASTSTSSRRSRRT